MTSEKLYYNLNLILNKNASLKTVSIPKPNFVILYNREALFWLDDYIGKHSSTEDIHNIQGLLKVDAPLVLDKSTSEYYDYILPEDYFQFVDSKSEASQNKCTRTVYNYFQKPKEIHVNLEFQKPSFKFEESVCNISDKKLRIYVDEYKINTSYLSYYITPTKIDLEGYIDLDTGNPSQNIDSDLDEYFQFQILDRVALEIQREFENTNAINILQSKINQQ